ncbi:MAG: DUF120 domain-containing protein [Candidatus Baldrarchaeia archaeon]
MIKDRLFTTLYVLAKLGACNRAVEISTVKLGKELGISQQSASRRLQELEKLGLIVREISRRGQLVRITERGLDMLRDFYYGLREILEGISPVIRIRGKLFTGLGEGRFYVSLEGYRRQFIEKLGFDPYPGTLNLKLVSKEDVDAYRSLLSSRNGIRIEGFSDEKRTYGDAICYPVLINGKIHGAIVKARRTHYGDDVVEVIAPVCLRDYLKLKDGDIIELIFERY